MFSESGSLDQFRAAAAAEFHGYTVTGSAVGAGLLRRGDRLCAAEDLLVLLIQCKDLPVQTLHIRPLLLDERQGGVEGRIVLAAGQPDLIGRFTALQQ